MVVPEAVDAECALAFHHPGMFKRLKAILFRLICILLGLACLLVGLTKNGEISLNPIVLFGAIIFLAFGFFGKDIVTGSDS